MFIKMIVLHKTGDGVKHFLWCVGLHGSFFIMREGVAVHVLFELIRSLPGIFFKCIIHIAVVGKSEAVADINQRKFTFHQQCFCIEIPGVGQKFTERTVQIFLNKML